MDANRFSIASAIVLILLGIGIVLYDHYRGGVHYPCANPGFYTGCPSHHKHR